MPQCAFKGNSGVSCLNARGANRIAQIAASREHALGKVVVADKLLRDLRMVDDAERREGAPGNIEESAKPGFSAHSSEPRVDKAGHGAGHCRNQDKNRRGKRDRLKCQRNPLLP